jgi:Resolvase, N terminal domain
LDYAREGDTMVVVVALDRLGRSLAGIVRTVETLREREVMLRSLREGIDYSTPVGRMVAGIFASLAADQVRLTQRMREAVEPVSVICTVLKVARSILYLALGDGRPGHHRTSPRPAERGRLFG